MGTSRKIITVDKLQYLESVLSSMVDALKEMETSNDSMENICARHGIDYGTFRVSIMMRADRYTIEKPTMMLSELECPEHDPYRNLFRDISKYKEKDLTSYVFPEDFEESMDHVIGTLTEREQKVINTIYGLDGDCPKTLDEAGELFNVTRSRIAQIRDKALRKLRIPRRFNIITHGLKSLEIEEKARKQAEASIKEEIQKRIDARAEELINDALINNAVDIFSFVANAKETDIDILDLSVRTYNCMKRSGCNTIYDLCIKDQESYMKIRNLGRLSLKELIDKLNLFLSKYGYTYEEVYAYLTSNEIKNIDLIELMLAKFNNIKTISEAKDLARELYKSRDKEIEEAESKAARATDIAEKYKEQLRICQQANPVRTVGKPFGMIDMSKYIYIYGENRINLLNAVNNILTGLGRQLLSNKLDISEDYVKDCIKNLNFSYEDLKSLLSYNYYAFVRHYQNKM